MGKPVFGSGKVEASSGLFTSTRMSPLDDDRIYLDEDEKRLTQPSQWARVASDKYKSVNETTKFLPAGGYDVNLDGDDRKPIFQEKKLLHDKIIPLSGLPRQIIKEIDEFWGKSETFKKFGFLHRRGYLFYGSHGTGKSSLVHEIATNIIADGGIVFYCVNPSLFSICLTGFREVEPERKIVCIFEDIDAIIRQHGEAQLLSLLDGENQIANVCNIATTNYPELLDKRIVGRPRRFDRVYRIGNLDEKARRAFLEFKLPEEADLNEWVGKTNGLSIASISEAIISVYCFEKTIEQAVEIMKTLAEDKTSDDDKDDLGFNSV